MESVSISSYVQQQQPQQTQSTDNQQQQLKATSSQTAVEQIRAGPETEPGTSQQKQNIYQVKCNLLEYHLQEAFLVNKALRSELKQYKDKIDFEKRLRKFLIDKVGASSEL